MAMSPEERERARLASEAAAIASAGRLLGELLVLQQRGEQIWMLERTFRHVGHPQILKLHRDGIEALAGPAIAAGEAESWPSLSDWYHRARVLISQYRTLYFTISNWITRGGGRLDQDLPGLLGRLRSQIDLLRNQLPPMPKIPEAPESSTGEDSDGLPILRP